MTLGQRSITRPYSDHITKGWSEHGKTRRSSSALGHTKPSAMSFDSTKFRFNPLRESDLPMLYEWLKRPHIAEWWRPTPSVDELRKRLTSYLAELKEQASGSVKDGI